MEKPSKQTIRYGQAEHQKSAVSANWHQNGNLRMEMANSARERIAGENRHAYRHGHD